MNRNQPSPPLITLGDDSTVGTYLLRMRVSRQLRLRFGRFRGGAFIDVPEGECIYVGSALGKPGSPALARRLVRHASRSGDRPPHDLRAVMMARFPQMGLCASDLDLRPRHGKRLFWNVDYLLEDLDVSLTQVMILRGRQRLEPRIGRLLTEDPCTFLLAPGLGANDVPGQSHLLGVRADEEWWNQLVRRLVQLTTGKDEAFAEGD
ncbi:MAG: DUF123 domain-containing protein [Anaerolineae bacterium]